MSVGWTCDKCGKFFTPDTAENQASVKIYQKHGDHIAIDLCEKCKERFDKWIEAKPLLGTEYERMIVDESSVYLSHATELWNRLRAKSKEYADDPVYRPLGYEAAPRVYFGNVHPLPNSSLEDKEFPKKVLEEAAEVYSAWEDYVEAVAKDDEDEIMNSLRHIALECGDVVQTCANMLHAVQKTSQEITPLVYATNVYDAQALMREIEKRNRERGRYDA